MAADRRNGSSFRPDPQRGDHMNPYGRTRGAAPIIGIVCGLLVVLALIWFFV
jgi:hypothetical protein